MLSIVILSVHPATRFHPLLPPAPRHHSSWLPDRIMYEEGAFTKDVLDKLRAMGHVVPDATATIGAANCIYIGEQNVYGAPDYRRHSGLAGY